MKALVGGSVLTGLVTGMSQLVGVPPGAAVTVVVLSLVFTFTLGLAQLALPQDSQDKRLLWEKMLAHRARRQASAAAEKRRSDQAEATTSPDTTPELPRSTPKRSLGRSP